MLKGIIKTFDINGVYVITFKENTAYAGKGATI